MRNQLLAIDDTALHLSVICKIAELEKFLTTGARSVDAAAALLHEAVFDCITLDLSLGDRSGVEILLLLAKMQYPAPVIVISGSGAETCREIVDLGNCLGLTVYPPIPKPINVALLRKSLRKIADGWARKPSLSVLGQRR